MPVKPSLVEQAAFALNVAPVPVLDYIGALGLHSVCLAEKLGLFQILQDAPQSAAQIALQLEANERGVSAVLDALESVGYVRKSDHQYALTAMASKWMPRLRQGMKFFEAMAFESWRDIEGKIRARTTEDRGSYEAQSVTPRHESFDGSLSNAQMSVDEVVRVAGLRRSARTLLDVGGGHGLYSARFCRRHPGLVATLVDFEAVLSQASRVINNEGVADRIETKPADFWKDDLGTGYDVVLLFNQLNAYPANLKLELLKKAAGTVAPDGVLIILDQMRQPALRGTARAIVQLTNLRLFDPSQRDTYSLADLQDLLPKVGLQTAKAVSLLSAPWLCLVVARRATANRT